MSQGSLIDIDDEASVAVAREAAREVAHKAGLDDTQRESLAVVVSELGHNQLSHAKAGSIRLRRMERAGVVGVEVEAVDSGPGIADPTRALGGRSEAPAGLGIGLAGVQRLAHEVDFDVRLGAGTRVLARLFSKPPPPTLEVAVLGRTADGEVVSGDDASFSRHDDVLRLVVADGVGHGPEARVASARALEVVAETAVASTADYFAAVDRALQGTRGAALTMVDVRHGEAEVCAFGNVIAAVSGADNLRRFGTRAGILGGMRPRGPAGPARRPRVTCESAVLPLGGAIVMFSDGVSNRLAQHGLPRELMRHPLIVAHEILTALGREHDDATVLVAR